VKVHIFVTDAFELKLELGVITDENQFFFFIFYFFYVFPSQLTKVKIDFLFVPITTYTTNLTDQ